MRKFDPWKRDETITLVRRYLSSIDELGYISQIYERKLDLLQRMLEDCKELESSETAAGRSPNNPGGVSMEERIQFATLFVKEVHTSCERFIKDLNVSMNAVSLSLNSLTMKKSADSLCNHSSSSFVQLNKMSLLLSQTLRTKPFSCLLE
jgi:hypothetical protein